MAPRSSAVQRAQYSRNEAGPNRAWVTVPLQRQTTVPGDRGRGHLRRLEASRCVPHRQRREVDAILAVEGRHPPAPGAMSESVEPKLELQLTPSFTGFVESRQQVR